MYPRQESLPPPNERSLGRAGHNLNALFLGVVSSLAAGAAVWLLAFGGIAAITDTAERVQFSSSIPWVTVGSPHQDVADAAVLTLGDLPPGWEVTDGFGGGSSFGEIGYESSDQCKDLESQLSSQGAMASAKSKSFKGPERQMLGSEASVFAGPDAAQSALDYSRGLFAQCGNDLINAFNAGFKRGVEIAGVPPDSIQVQTALHDLGAPPVGESGYVYRIAGTMTGPGGSADFAVDLIAFRHGRMNAGFLHTTFNGAGLDQQPQLLQAAANKLQAANASLPQIEPS